MASGSESSYIFGFLIFIGFLVAIVAAGAPTILASVPAAPALPAFPTSSGTWLPISGVDWGTAFIDFVTDIIIGVLYLFELALWSMTEIWYFVELVGITAVAYPVAGVVITAFGGVVLFAVIGTVRGK
ncbi:MAG: hypothetical protein NT016_01715 [Candidatus Aenigmarchaeota archaeon]|nr:hypothetical protein [Candidatus Aenigmarchaeota archaeon]